MRCTIGPDLPPSVIPTYQWIRLAQQVPVRMQLEPVPKEIELRVGTTASVLVMTEGGGEKTGARQCRRHCRRFSASQRNHTRRTWCIAYLQLYTFLNRKLLKWRAR